MCVFASSSKSKGLVSVSIKAGGKADQYTHSCVHLLKNADCQCLLQLVVPPGNSQSCSGDQ